MKKTIFAVLATFCSLTAIGQPLGRPLYFDDFLFPPYMQRGCYDINTYIPTGIFSNALYDAIAQPFYIDSTISLKGIAAFVDLNQRVLRNIGKPYYMQIRDASLNRVLAQVRYDTLRIASCYFENSSGVPHGIFYIEQLFDTTVFISDSIFYITVTWPSDTDVFEHAGSVYINNSVRLNATCNTDVYPLLVLTKNQSWMPLIDVIQENPIYLQGGGFDTMETPTELFLFPIKGEVTTSLPSVDLAKNVSVYPNPTKNSLTVSGEGFDRLKIYDMIGRELIAKEVVSNETIVDVASLPTGMYYVELYSQNRVVGRKKLIRN